MADTGGFSLFSWFFGRGKTTGRTRQPARTPVVAPSEPLNAAEIALAADGRPIHAIKAYRERTGASLKEAKQALDHAQALGLDAQRIAHHAAQTPPVFGKELLTPEEQALIARGQKIAAIKMVRERTGLGLKDAKALVDSAQRH